MSNWRNDQAIWGYQGNQSHHGPATFSGLSGFEMGIASTLVLLQILTFLYVRQATLVIDQLSDFENHLVMFNGEVLDLGTFPQSNSAGSMYI